MWVTLLSTLTNTTNLSVIIGTLNNAPMGNDRGEQTVSYR